MASTSEKAWALLESALTGYISDASLLPQLEARLERTVPPRQREAISGLLACSSLSYRDGLLLQLAYKLADPGLDATLRPEGARGTAQRLGKLLKSSHIHGVNDAYENIGKNTSQLVRGTLLVWDELLPWLNAAGREQLRSAFRYACCQVASTSRPVRPMPELDTAKLTFAAVMDVYERLLGVPSTGVHEQFIVASLLHAFVNAHAPELYVDTKAVSVSDRSSGTAGDIQIKRGSRVLEAYEVTAAGWEGKLQGVASKLREHDLTRMHVVAPVAAGGYTEALASLLELPEDISVVDLRGFVSVVASALTHQDRAHALRRMYELLDRIQRDVELVNQYVAVLSDCGLVLAS